jgi:hypothetical protein
VQSFPWDTNLVCDGPNFPFEKVLGTERYRSALISEMAFSGKHQGIRRCIGAKPSPGLDVGSNTLWDWNPSATVLGFHLAFVQRTFVGGVVDDEAYNPPVNILVALCQRPSRIVR